MNEDFAVVESDGQQRLLDGRVGGHGGGQGQASQGGASSGVELEDGR